MKKFLLSILCCLLAVCGYAQDTATLSFANKEQRTSYSSTIQVWEQNGITLTNNKASSTTAVGNYAKPARFYASSEIIIECSLGNITQIEFIVIQLLMREHCRVQLVTQVPFHLIN